MNPLHCISSGFALVRELLSSRSATGFRRKLDKRCFTAPQGAPALHYGGALD